MKKKRLAQYHRLRTDLPEEIQRVLDKVGEECLEVEDIVPERQFKHKQGRSYIGVKRVANACVKAGIYLRDGYGVSVDFVLTQERKLATVCKGLIEKLTHRKYQPSPT